MVPEYPARQYRNPRSWHRPDDPLDVSEQRFIMEYLANGYNGTAAYQAIRPRVSPGSANTLAARWLADIRIQREIEQRLIQDVASLPRCIQESDSLQRLAIKQEKLSSALKALDIKAKLAGHYQRKADDGDAYGGLMQALGVGKGKRVRVGVDIQDTPDTVDVTCNIPDTVDVICNTPLDIGGE